jgi:hypothetical protein
MPTHIGAKQSPTLLRIEAASGLKARRNTMRKEERKRGDDAAVSIEESSGNIFGDWGLKNPEELLAKAWLVQRHPVFNGERHQRTIDCAG